MSARWPAIATWCSTTSPTSAQKAALATINGNMARQVAGPSARRAIASGAGAHRVATESSTISAIAIW
jgi:hypothetical protein